MKLHVFLSPTKPKPWTCQSFQFLGLLLFGLFSLLIFFKIDISLLDNMFNDMVLGGRGLAYTRENERDIEPVAAADCKRKEPKVACLACLALVKKKIWKRENKEIDFFIFCLKIMLFEAIFLLGWTHSSLQRRLYQKFIIKKTFIYGKLKRSTLYVSIFLHFCIFVRATTKKVFFFKKI